MYIYGIFKCKVKCFNYKNVFFTEFVYNVYIQAQVWLIKLTFYVIVH